MKARSGDVLLFTAADDDPISKTISRVTGSPYSHTAICYGEDQYAHAFAGADKDVALIDAPALDASAGRREIHLFRPAGASFDADAMGREVEARRKDAAEPPPGRLTFSDGALAGLAVLRLVASNEPIPWLSREFRDRLRRALVVALDDGHRRLFCSEFAYRVSAAGGFVPPLPAQPFIPADALKPPRGLTGDVLEAVVARVKRWLVRTMQLDADSMLTFAEVWGRVVEAFRRDAQVPKGVAVANFYVPGDFVAAKDTYRLTAAWQPKVGWAAPGS